jgi:hypothetical protein
MRIIAIICGLVGGIALAFPANAQSDSLIPRNFVGTMECTLRNDSIDVSFAIPGRRQTEDALRSLGAQAEAVETWIDLSLSNNGFPEGTFIGSGPFAPQTSGGSGAFSWSGILPGRTHFFRLNVKTEDGRWYIIGRGSFDSPDCTTLTAMACNDIQANTVDVAFRVSGAPPAAIGRLPDLPWPVAIGWIDLSTFDNGFAQGTFIAAGPVLPVLRVSEYDDSYYFWSGLRGATKHYYRLNLLRTDATWQVTPTPRGSFRTLDCRDLPEYSPAFG